MQQPPSPAPPQNQLAEIAALFFGGLLIVGGVILLALGKIDFPYATSIFLLAVGILAANVALKAPSPTQQAQIQAIVTQFMDVIPGLFARLQTPTPAPPIVIHLPPLASVPASTPVQIIPGALNTTTSINPQMVNVPTQISPTGLQNMTAGNSWQTQVAPIPGGGTDVPQQAFPERFAGPPPVGTGP